MSFKVAVASSDGKVINRHFGRSRQFLIFNISDDGQYKFEENRESKPPCDSGDHHEDVMMDAAKALSDCRYVLVNQIGPGAEQVLKSHGIQAFSLTDYIDNALTKIIDFEKKKKSL